MNREHDDTTRDPLGLGDLPLLSPDVDGWPAIRSALAEHATGAVTRRRRTGWAMAACLVLATTLALINLDPAPQTPTVASVDPADRANGSPSVASPGSPSGDMADDDTLADLIALSQLLESRLRQLRDNTTALPAESAVYLAELEDMIARVDGELSYSPDAVDLWGQRVNLLLDLEFIYKHHFEREYGRMASR